MNIDDFIYGTGRDHSALQSRKLELSAREKKIYQEYLAARRSLNEAARSLEYDRFEATKKVADDRGATYEQIRHFIQNIKRKGWWV